jgi:hypothetical protein
MQAQEQMVKVQKQAKSIVIGSGNVQRIRWELDRSWLAEKGITP